MFEERSIAVCAYGLEAVLAAAFGTGLIVLD